MDKFSLVGHSLGGGIAHAYTLAHPDKVNKLVLIDGAGIDAHTTWFGRLLMSLFTIKARLKKDETYLSVVQNGDVAPQTFTDRLSEIKVPTLIVWGKRDGYLPVRQAYKAHRLIRSSRLHIFEDAWHAPHKEHPKEFNRLLLDFFAAWLNSSLELVR